MVDKKQRKNQAAIFKRTILLLSVLVLFILAPFQMNPGDSNTSTPTLQEGEESCLLSEQNSGKELLTLQQAHAQPMTGEDGFQDEAQAANDETQQYADQTASQGSVDSQENDQNNSCGWSNPMACLTNFIEIAIEKFAFIILSLPAGIMWMAAQLFNASITFTVVDMGNILSGGSGSGASGTGIEAAWQILRDLANIVFIFVLIWIGVATILQIPNYNYKKLLPTLIIAALLVNFSLFITQFVIDGSNLMASHALELVEGEGVDCDYSNTNNNCEEGGGIAGRFIEELGIPSLWDADQEVLSNIGGDVGRLILFTVLAATFMMVLAFVILAAAILLITRFIVLTFLMIISPLAFAAMVLPQTRGQAKKWFSSLFNQAFFAPFLLLFIYMSLLIIQGVSGVGVGAEGGNNSGEGANNMASALIGKAGSAEMFLTFTITIGFLVGSILLAKFMGAAGGKKAAEIGGKARRKAQGIAGGQTVGRFSRSLAESDRLKDEQSRGGMRGTIASGLRDIGKAGANTHFGGKSFQQARNEKEEKRRQTRKELGQSPNLDKGSLDKRQQDYTKARKRSRMKSEREIGKKLESEAKKEKRGKMKASGPSKSFGGSTEESMGELQQIVGTDKRGNTQ